jgi:pimeloyl-ACP methyl ester carboxylesterase
MAAKTRAQAADEHFVYIPVGADRVFGVLTEPVRKPSGLGVLLLSGGMYNLSTARNRMFVDLARDLAGYGHRVLRIDYHGVGESTGVVGSWALDDPNPADVMGAIECLTAGRRTDFVVVGNCFGARAAMHTLADDARLRSMVLLAPPLADEGFGEVDASCGVGALFLRHAETLRARGIPALFVYGAEDRYYHDFKSVRHTRLEALFSADSSLEMQVVPGELHGITGVKAQEMFVRTTLDWISEITTDERPSARGESTPVRLRAG